MKTALKQKAKSKTLNNKGRIRPVILGLILIIAGLFLDHLFWQMGVIILIIVFIEGYYHYPPLN